MRVYREEEKRHWLSELESSCLLARAYAESKPFSIASFNNWRRKGIKNKKASSFIEVVADRSVHQPTIRLTYPTGVVLELYDWVDVPSLKALVQ